MRPRLLQRWLVLSSAMTFLLIGSCTAAQKCLPPRSAPEITLATLLNRHDLNAVQRLLEKAYPCNCAPSPEMRERYDPLQLPSWRDHPITTTTQAYLAKAQQMNWWSRKTPVNPQHIPAPLRAPAGLVRGLLAIASVDSAQKDQALNAAIAAGDYLLKASHEARFDGAPFPYWRQRTGDLGSFSERMALRLERCGQLDRAIRGNWFVVEALPWEYFFDTGMAGEAYVALYLKTQEHRFLEGAIKAAKWSQRQPISTNWNYNAFLASFFAELYGATGDQHWREQAIERIRYGVIPGMIAHGSDAGHWRDPHNERIAYRVIMARALVQVAGAAVTTKDLQAIQTAAQLVIDAIERQMRLQGTASVSAMAQLYAAIDRVNAKAVPISSHDPQLRNIITHQAIERLLVGKATPDAGSGDAIRWIATLNEQSMHYNASF